MRASRSRGSGWRAGRLDEPVESTARQPESSRSVAGRLRLRAAWGGVDGGMGRNLSSAGTREVLLSFVGRWRDRRRQQREQRQRAEERLREQRQRAKERLDDLARQTASTLESRLELYESVMRAVGEWNEPFIITFKSRDKPECFFQFSGKGQDPSAAFASRPAAEASKQGRRALERLGLALLGSNPAGEQYLNDEIKFEIPSMAKLVEDVFIEAFGCSGSYSGQLAEIEHG